MNEEDKKEIKEERKRTVRKKTIYSILSILVTIIVTIGIALSMEFTSSPHIQIIFLVIAIIVGLFILIGYIKVRNAVDKVKEEEFELGFSPSAEKEYDKDYEDNEIDTKNMKSLLLLSLTVGRYYQVIKKDGQFIFLFIGNQFSGIHTEELIEDNEIYKMDLPEILTNKKNFVIEENEIIKCKIRRFLGNGNNTAVGYFTVFYKKKKKTFGLVSSNIEMVNNFFPNVENLPVRNKKIRESNIDSAVDDSIDNRKYRTLKNITWGLDFIAIIIGCVFMFTGFSYFWCSMGLIICFFSFLLLYILFPKVYTFLEIRKGEQKRRKIFISFQPIAVIAIMGVRDVLDFTFLEYGKYVITSLVFAVILFFILLIFTKEYRKVKTVMIFIVMNALFFGFAITPNINYNFNYNEPAIYTSEVLDKKISTSDDSPDTYYVKIILSNGETKQIKISKDFYSKIEIGDSVEVGEVVGALGIPYCFIKEE